MLFAYRYFKVFFKIGNLGKLGMLNSISLVNQVLQCEVILKERADQEGLRLTPTVKA